MSAEPAGVVSTDDERIRGATREIVAEILELEEGDVLDDATFVALGADSIQQLEIVAALRLRFGVHYTLKEESELATVDDAVEITRCHLLSLT